MTGDLNMLMKFRDLKAAEDVGKKAALGWFDVEFTMYGCAYWDQANDKMYYKVSSVAQDIYDFIEKSIVGDIYPSNIMCLTEKCPVPSGMRDFIAQDIKIKLAKQLQALYPKEFFKMLYDLAKEHVNDSAATLLWEEAENLEGVFEEEQLRHFEELVNYTKSCLNIDSIQYYKFLAWISEERKNMNDDFVSKDIFEKTLYGIAYFEAGNLKYMKYMIDAQKAHIYKKVFQMEQQGFFVTPVLSQQYWYNYEYRLPDVINNFRNKVKTEYDHHFIEKIKLICDQRKQKITETEFQTMKQNVQQKFGTEPVETLMRYAYHWGILRKSLAE